MKKTIVSILSLLLAFTFLLSGCASSLAPLTTGEAGTSETEKQTLTESTKETKEEAKKTEEDKKSQDDQVMQKENPKNDDTLNILMIGNSFCYFFVDELYGMLKAAGIKAKVCNVYYSGCTVSQHWNWLLDNANEYKFYTTDENGRTGVSNMSLKKCLQQGNWDVITLQQSLSPSRASTYENAMNDTQSYAKKLYDFLRGQFPQSDFYWHQTWAYEKGYNRSNGVIETDAAQQKQHEVIRQVAHAVASENNVILIPSGDAWALARKNPVIGDTLCVGTDKNSGSGDHYHDGDLGGGQYLNACTYFEVITGKSCIGNSFTPSYALGAEKISALQSAANAAVRARN